LRKIKFILDKFDTELGKDNRIELGLQKFDQYYLHSEFKKWISGEWANYLCSAVQPGRHFYFTDRLYQFHEPDYRTIHEERQGSGVRKVMGALRSVLIPQFIREAVLMATIAATGALILARSCITGL
jgi:hypothetical protein